MRDRYSGYQDHGGTYKRVTYLHGDLHLDLSDTDLDLQLYHKHTSCCTGSSGMCVVRFEIGVG